MIKPTQFDVEFVNLGSLKKGWMSLELNASIDKFKSNNNKKNPLYLLEEREKSQLLAQWLPSL